VRSPIYLLLVDEFSIQKLVQRPLATAYPAGTIADRVFFNAELYSLFHGMQGKNEAKTNFFYAAQMLYRQAFAVD